MIRLEVETRVRLGECGDHVLRDALLEVVDVVHKAQTNPAPPPQPRAWPWTLLPQAPAVEDAPGRLSLEYYARAWLRFGKYLYVSSLVTYFIGGSLWTLVVANRAG